ncbi:N-acetyltransferase [Streptomyces sp. KLOTTS4A1]|uniref:N-acetyltransferase n=1 Tax=Streptomyces sp. KLOTTS4A1 TaxID=3390996 RepID=UPI0039F63ACE
MSDITVSTLAERPHLKGAMDSMPETWHEFVRNDLIGWSHYPRIADELPEYTFVATDADGTVVAKAMSVPFALGIPARGELPAGGWGRVLQWAFSDLKYGRTPDTVSAIEISVADGQQGRGLSYTMLGAMRDNARARGFAEVVAPVRPNAKHLEPRTPIDEYAFRVREEDGLPADPWLRVHVRAGGVIARVAPTSMCVTGTLDQWRAWTGEPFDEAGEIEVPGALVPVHCVPERDYAVYVEPNVWVRHAL